MAIGPEHYREAERLLEHATSTFLDSSDDPAPRAEYATEAEYVEALQISNDLHEQAMRTAAWTTAQAQVHATLALAAATRDAGIPRGQVLVAQCDIAESAYGRQCTRADGHTGDHDFEGGTA
ncbi:hypothetical protein ACFZB2_38365 [Streptomyces bobili]|uniref:hypothetical protein n=1 Tax=Streptomyces bobili TaxID=67280 RepID=UPI0036EE0F43